MQRRVVVGRVHGHAAHMRIGVERAAGRDEGADVGDRVTDAVARPRPLDVQRLVEVARTGRVDRDERHVDARLRGLSPESRRTLRLRVGLRTERLGDLRLAAHRVEPVAHRLRGRDLDPAARHRGSVLAKRRHTDLGSPQQGGRLRVQIGRLTAVTLAAALLGSSSAAAAITKVVTFDDQAAGTTITDQYRAADGVRFDGQAASDGFSPYVDQPGAMIAHSGDRVADINHCVGQCGEGFFNPRTVGRLDTTANAVSMYVGYLANGGSSTAHLVLTALDASGNPVASQEADVTEGMPFTTKLEVVASAPIIAAFVLEVPSGDHSEPVGFDDLTIAYSDAPPPPDFSLSPGIGVLDVLQGNSLDDPLTLNRINGSNGDVTFSVSGLPTGMTATFAPNPVPGQGTATTMTLHAADSAAFSPEYSTITITATPSNAAGPEPRSITALTRISQNCDRTVRFPYVDARSPGCFFKRGHEYATHNTDVRVNGLILKPLDGDRELDINDSTKTIKSVRSTYAVAIDTDPDIPLYYGPIDWDFSGLVDRQPRAGRARPERSSRSQRTVDRRAVGLVHPGRQGGAAPDAEARVLAVQLLRLADRDHAVHDQQRPRARLHRPR